MKYLWLLSTLVLVSCGIIRDRSSEYVQAQAGSEIALPEGLTDQNIQSQYPIPEISNKRTVALDYELPKPPNATATLDEAPYTIEQVNDNVWMRLYLAPGKVWPLIDAFWQEYGIETVQENISSGFVVTKALIDPKDLKAKLNEKTQQDLDLNNVYFQASLTQGIRRNTSEIKLRVLPLDQNGIQQDWVKQSTDVEREKAILALIGDFVTSDALQNRYSLLANTIGGESRVQLLQDKEGQNFLLLSLSFQRAWNELSKALTASEIVVSDTDVSEKKFFISYLNESEIDKWYLTTDNVAEKKLERNFSLDVIEMENGSIKVEIQLLNEDLEPSLKNDIMDLIFEHIS